MRLPPLVLSLCLCMSLSLAAQHNKSSLLQPSCESLNLREKPCRVVVVQRYVSGNDNNYQETYLFDSLGLLVEYRKRGFGGERVTSYPLSVESLSQNRQYLFDYDGDVLEMRQFDLRGRLIASTHCIYAVGGNLAQSIEYAYDADSGIVTRRTVSDYDKHERLAKVSQYSADELLLWEEKRKYDRRGNMVRRVQTFYNDGKKEVTVEKRLYTFDRHGNWTSCLYSLNGKTLYSVEREISY